MRNSLRSLQPKPPDSFLMHAIPSRLFPLVVLLFLGVKPFAVIGQQPTLSPTPQRTGKSYSSETPTKKPPPPAPQAQSPGTFTDISSLTGINFKRAPSFTSVKYLLEATGGGVAMFDYDNDGRMDLFFTNGASLKDPMPKAEMPDKRDPKYWNANTSGSYLASNDPRIIVGLGATASVRKS